jgi:uncharacterized protein (TIGR00159 family)
MPFPPIRFVDILDILMVSALIYWLYRLVRGTNIMRIFWAIIVIYIAWRVFALLNMRLCSQIFGGIISIGLISLVIVFQPEIRKFLLFVGTKTSLAGDSFIKRFRFWRNDASKKSGPNFDPYVQACMHMSPSKTGALIIFKRSNDLEEIIDTGVRINADTSSALLEALFFKNSPLHDGAMVVSRNRIKAAACILPVSHDLDIPKEFGLRHRAALGISQEVDALAIAVSEETGRISIAINGELKPRLSAEDLESILTKEMNFEESEGVKE